MAPTSCASTSGFIAIRARLSGSASSPLVTWIAWVLAADTSFAPRFFDPAIEFDLATLVGETYPPEVHIFHAIEKKIRGKLLLTLIVWFECNSANPVAKGFLQPGGIQALIGSSIYEKFAVMTR